MPDRSLIPGPADPVRTATPPRAAGIRGIFHDHKRLEGAVSRLEGMSFARADSSVVRERRDGGEEGASEPPDAMVAGSDARQVQTLGAGLAGAVTGLAPAGVVALTGGGRGQRRRHRRPGGAGRGCSAQRRPDADGSVRRHGPRGSGRSRTQAGRTEARARRPWHAGRGPRAVAGPSIL
jgi:hypothetical protein